MLLFSPDDDNYFAFYRFLPEIIRDFLQGTAFCFFKHFCQLATDAAGTLVSKVIGQFIQRPYQSYWRFINN